MRTATLVGLFVFAPLLAAAQQPPSAPARSAPRATAPDAGASAARRERPVPQLETNAQIAQDPFEVRSGSIVAVQVLEPGNVTWKSGHAMFLRKTFAMFHGFGGGLTALIPVPFSVRPGPQHVMMTVTDDQDRTRQIEHVLEIERSKRHTGALEIPAGWKKPSKSVMRAARLESKKLMRLLSRHSKKRRWSGAFTPPCADACKRSGAYGELRRTAGRHPKKDLLLGTEYEGPEGNDVKAIGAGRVIFVEELLEPGKLVVVDHGQGLYSLYAHLKRMDVKIGAAVTRGQVIGLLGQTGKIVGPHLWLGVASSAIFVDPEVLFSLKL